MKRTASRELTHAKLLETGLNLFNQQGYHGTGIKDVVTAAGLPKGSFYTYFESKEAFGSEVAQFFSQTGAERLKKAAAAPDKTPVEALTGFFQGNKNRLITHNYEGGCLLGNLSNELGAVNKIIAPELVKGLEALAAGIADLIQKGQDTGEIRRDLDAQTLGDTVLNAWEGALIRAKTQENPAPLDQFIKTYFQVLLKP